MTKKKFLVCHLTSVHERYDMRIFQKECVSLQINGFETCLIVADNKGNEEKDGVRIIDVGKSGSRAKRLFQTLSRIYRKAIELDADVYHFHDPELLFVGIMLKRSHKKVIWDMHENLPADIMQKKYIPLFFRFIINSVYIRLEKWVVKRIDGVICTRDSVLYRLYNLNENIEVINNFPITSYSPEIPNKRERAICFAGAIVSNYQHKEIIEAISEIDDIKYLLAGPINDKYLSILKNTKGWEKVEYLGVLNFSEVKEMYSRSQIGMVVHKYTPNMDYKVGNFALTKIFEVMYFAMPVIATDYSIWNDLVFEEYDCAKTVNPTNVQEIRSAILELLNNPEKSAEMGINGQRAVINKFNWGTQERKLVKLYNRVLD